MLLVRDEDRHLASMRAEEATTAFVPDIRFDSTERAREFLGLFDPDEFWFVAALSEEVKRGAVTPASGTGVREVIDAAASAIATGTILLARPLQAGWSARFDRTRPMAARINVLGIPNYAAALSVARTILANRGSAAALEQALHHMAGERGLRSVSPSAAAKLLGQPIPDPPTWPPEFGLTVEQIARLFRGYWLVLRPRSWDGRCFDLAWAVHSSGGTDDTDSAADDPAPARRPVPPPQVEGPRSQLPVPTGTPSPQLEALIAAAAAGVPFCEECLAAALAGGANAV